MGEGIVIEDFKKESTIKCIEQMLEDLDVIRGDGYVEEDPELAIDIGKAIKYLELALDLVKRK